MRDSYFPQNVRKSPYISYDNLTMNTPPTSVVKIPQVVYCIICNNCDQTSVGEPSLSLAEQIREDPSDAVVLHLNNQNKTLASLQPESVIGTSSLRRIAQLRRRYPHLLFQNIRGNLNTRLRKLDENNTYSALILANAGLQRMGWKNRISATLPPEDCMHAVGQGALAVEIRANDRDILDILAPLTDKDTVLQCIAERSFLKKLEGGCSVPVGVYSSFKKGKLFLQGGVFSLDGAKAVIHCLETDICIQEKENEPSDSQEKEELKEFCGVVVSHLNQQLLNKAFKLGLDLANYLLEKGAKEILDEARKANEASDTL
ncbi:porphobilinogen deaminase-like [Limulus polyphemus]|uniref:hydroxymethylbilane synthase n=1 Tax=Limulus polyphemus TaxID=6850 RepID=A0ABM1B2R1_LIMPO|nr:porphobilinogen deaminase-like [Limulus polyphemus]